MEIRSLHGIFFSGIMCVKKLHVQILLSLCVRTFAATAVRLLEFYLGMVFFVCVGSVWRNLHVLILLFWWGFCCWFKFFWVNLQVHILLR
jgi:hypothetical protein